MNEELPDGTDNSDELMLNQLHATTNELTFVMNGSEVIILK